MTNCSNAGIWRLLHKKVDICVEGGGALHGLASRKSGWGSSQSSSLDKEDWILQSEEAQAKAEAESQKLRNGCHVAVSGNAEMLLIAEATGKHTKRKEEECGVRRGRNAGALLN